MTPNQYASASVGKVRKVGTVRHEVRDASGVLWGIHTRRYRADGTKKMAWEHQNGTGAKEMPLYGSERVPTFDPETPIFITEGEADADALLHAGFQALGTVTGASTIPDPFAFEVVTGRDVVLWADNDQPGRDHMRKVARLLAPLVRSLLAVRPDDAPLGGGATDFLAEHSADDVRDLLDAAQPPKISRLEVVPLAEVDTSDPKPLLLGRLDPEDHTILFGDGGTGKGVVTAWWVARLSREGEIVLILDYERHARYEWRPRVEAFGGDLDRVLIAQPTDAIWNLVDDLAADIEQAGVTFLVVDSIGYACLGQEVEKSTTATRYQLAISELTVPTLSLAHTTKAIVDPKHPFGSVYWSNGARITIAMTGQGDEPRVLTNKKTNQRAAFAPVEIAWDWVATGLPPTLTEQEKTVTIADRAYEALAFDQMERADLLARINADGGVPVSDHSLRTILARDGRFRQEGKAWMRLLRPIKTRVANRGIG